MNIQHAEKHLAMLSGLPLSTYTFLIYDFRFDDHELNDTLSELVDDYMLLVTLKYMATFTLNKYIVGKSRSDQVVIRALDQGSDQWCGDVFTHIKFGVARFHNRGQLWLGLKIYWHKGSLVVVEPGEKLPRNENPQDLPSGAVHSMVRSFQWLNKHTLLYC